MEESKLENAVQESWLKKCVNKPWQFTKKHWKKAAKITSGVVLAGLIGASYIAFKREGMPISGQIDGKIDAAYYHELFEKNEKIKDISKIEDLVAEVYHLNTGRKIEDDFRFTLYKNKPVRVKITEWYGKQELGGLNWGNGDLYIKESDFLSAIRFVFHEPGHGRTESITGHVDYFKKNLNDTEPAAEKNVVDSMIALMYLEPDLGYCIYSNYIAENFSHDSLFKNNKNKWQSATNLNQIRCIEKGNFEIKDAYASNEAVTQIVEERTKGKKNNEFIAQMYSGTLEMFKQRFKDRPDFDEKFEKLQKYMRCGTTDRAYSKLFTPKQELIQKVKEKEDFLKEEHSEVITENVTESLLGDYRYLKEDEKAYALENKVIDKNVKDGKVDKLTMFIIANNLDYAIKQNYTARAKELLELLNKANENKNEEWIKRKIESYKKYL